jgi:potassium transporter
VLQARTRCRAGRASRARSALADHLGVDPDRRRQVRGGGSPRSRCSAWRRSRAARGSWPRSRRGTPWVPGQLDEIEKSQVPRVPGTAVILTLTTTGAPPLLLDHVRHNKALHQEVVLLSVITEERPRGAGRRAHRGGEASARLPPGAGAVRVHGTARRADHHRPIHQAPAWPVEPASAVSSASGKFVAMAEGWRAMRSAAIGVALESTTRPKEET